MLIAIAMCWPMLTTAYAFPAPAVTTGVLAHLTVTGTGTAVGLLRSQPVLHSIGWSAVAGGGTTLVAVTQTWLPPVGLTLRSLNDSPAPTVTLAVQAALGLTLPAAASAPTVVVHNRR